VFAWVAAWSLLRHDPAEFDDELDQAAEHTCPRCPGCELPWHTCPVCYCTTYHHDLAELDDRPAGLVEIPSEPDDPVGHYSALARRYARPEVWQQRGPDEPAHVITDAIHPMRGPVGPELDHTAEIDVQEAELSTWPAAQDLAASMAAEAALARIRAHFRELRDRLL
jgi:hypothetical protein